MPTDFCLKLPKRTVTVIPCRDAPATVSGCDVITILRNLLSRLYIQNFSEEREKKKGEPKTTTATTTTNKQTAERHLEIIKNVTSRQSQSNRCDWQGKFTRRTREPSWDKCCLVSRGILLSRFNRLVHSFTMLFLRANSPLNESNDWKTSLNQI